MRDKVCIVTGSNSGIGKETALALAQMKAHVVMLCRNRERGAAAQSEIERATGNRVALMIADLASQASIRSFVAEFQAQYDRLDVLVNNAGTVFPERTLTVDGIEATLATNHLSYFLLTNLLLDLLQRSAPARVVNVSSVGHRYATLDFEDLQSEKSYNQFKAYALSKLCNVMFTYELARRLEGSGVTANCLHPGGVRTNIWGKGGLLGTLVGVLGYPFMRSARRGAQTSIFLASWPAVANISGKYFEDCRERESSPASYDRAAQARLWRTSADLTHL